MHSAAQWHLSATQQFRFFCLRQRGTNPPLVLPPATVKIAGLPVPLAPLTLSIQGMELYGMYVNFCEAIQILACVQISHVYSFLTGSLKETFVPLPVRVNEVPVLPVEVKLPSGEVRNWSNSHTNKFDTIYILG
jgi:hypothetical protein